MAKPVSFRSFALIAAVIAVCAGCLWYVVAPPKGPTAYRERMASSAQTLLSQVQTTRIWAQVVADDKAMDSTTLVAFKETESDASSAASQFENYEPPSGTLKLREQYVKIADETTGVLAEFRIAAEQGRWQEIPVLSAELQPLIEALEAFERKAKP